MTYKRGDVGIAPYVTELTLCLGRQHCPSGMPESEKTGIRKTEYLFGKHLGLHQLDDCHLSSVAPTLAGAGHSGVAAVAVSVLGSDLLEQLMSHILFGDE